MNQINKHVHLYKNEDIAEDFSLYFSQHRRLQAATWRRKYSSEGDNSLNFALIAQLSWMWYLQTFNTAPLEGVQSTQPYRPAHSKLNHSSFIPETLIRFLLNGSKKKDFTSHQLDAKDANDKSDVTVGEWGGGEGGICNNQ